MFVAKVGRATKNLEDTLMKSHIIARMAVATLVAATLLCAPAGQAAPPADTTTSVIVQAADPATATRLVAAVGGTVTHELDIIRAVGARLTATQRDRLAGLQGVLHLHEDRRLEVDSESAQWYVADNFDAVSFANSDGTGSWEGDWVEDDPQAGGDGPAAGQVRVVSGGYMRLDDRPDTGGEPSLSRAVDLHGEATQATLSFRYATNGGVDPEDEVLLEISTDGGATHTVLDAFTNVDGYTEGFKSYDISGFATADSMIRFRLVRGYGGSKEHFYVDNLRIDYVGGLGDHGDAGNTFFQDVAGLREVHDDGLLGQGVTVAVVDTGSRYSLPAALYRPDGSARSILRYDAITDRIDRRWSDAFLWNQAVAVTNVWVDQE